MLLKRLSLVALASIGVALSGALAAAQLNRAPSPPATGRSVSGMPCDRAMAPGGMMNRGMGMDHLWISNELDYLSLMIPHHQEAIATAQAVLERSDRPEMRTFAQEIIRVQKAEIQQMQAWLNEWYPGQKATQTYTPMMSDLSQLKGNDLDRAFLQDMVMHHREAIMMSHWLLRHNLAQHESIRPFAEQIATTQMQEIHQMQAWLQNWYGIGRMGGMGGMRRMGGMRGW